MERSIIRRSVGILFALALVTAVAGCGSADVRNTRSEPRTSHNAIASRSVGLVDIDTSSLVQAAVGDLTHGMILTAEPAGSSDRSVVSGATVYDTASGTVAKVSLPDLDSATLVPWSGGYAVGGAHCTQRSTQGAEKECTTWVPTVAFLRANGTLDKIVTGAEQRSATSFVTVNPGNDDVIFRIADGRWESVDESGFTDIPGTKGMTGVCRAADGDYIGVTSAPAGAMNGNASEEQGALKLQISHDGAWSVLPGDTTYGQAAGTSVLFRCVVGGLVTTFGTVTDASGPKGGTRSPEHYGTADDLVVNAVGIDSMGGVLLSFPPSVKLAPQVVGGTSTMRRKIDESDRWAGMSADGRNVLLGSASGTRIVAADA